MFDLSLSTQKYLYSHPTDMRKSFDDLSEIVTNEFKLNPPKDEFFIFVNKLHDRSYCRVDIICLPFL